MTRLPVEWEELAGHAGLFSTAEDLARYARMLLNGGSHEGRQILKLENSALDVLGAIAVKHLCATRSGF